MNAPLLDLGALAVDLAGLERAWSQREYAAAAGREPVQLCMGMGVDSAAILTRWLLEPASRDFDLADLTVVTAMTGEEYDSTRQAMERFLLPLMRAHYVRYVQVSRAGQSDVDGHLVLDDSLTPQKMIMRGLWRLSDEYWPTGTLPATTGPRKCSMRAKGVPLDQFAAAEWGSSGRVVAVGFAAEETGRAVTDGHYAGTARRPFYPLIEWGWDREKCLAYLADTFGVEWPRSCCTFCPFAGGSRVKDARLARRWRSEPDAAADAIALEYLSLCFNPRMSLFSRSKARDVAAERGLQDVVDRADSAVAARPWGLYDVRRVIRRKGDATVGKVIRLGPDPAVRGQPYRSVRALATGRASEMSARLYADGAGRFDDDGVTVRRWLTESGETFPRAERFLVAAPAGVIDKEQKSFERVWRHALAYQGR